MSILLSVRYADVQMSAVHPFRPVFLRDHPRLLRRHIRQAVHHRLAERRVGDIMLKKEHLVLGRLVSDLAQRPHKVSDRIPRAPRPA